MFSPDPPGLSRDSLLPPEHLLSHNKSAVKRDYDDVSRMVASKPKWLSLFHQDNGCNFTTRLSVAPIFYYGKQPSPGERAKIITRRIVDENSVIVVKLIPALIEHGDDIASPMYPGQTEEIIFEVLKKMTMDNRGKTLDNSLAVLFYIRDIQRELNAIGKSRSHEEIIQSLTILRRASFVYEGTSSRRFEESYLLSLGLEDLPEGPNRERRTVVRFNEVVSNEIRTARYRCIDYETMIRLPILGRKLLDHIVYKFKELNTKSKHYKFKLSDFLAAIGMEMQTRPRDSQNKMNKALDLITVRSREKLQQARDKAKEEGKIKKYLKLARELDELKSSPIKCKFQSYIVRPIKDGRRVVDYKYTLIPTLGFETDIVKTNWAQNDIRMQLREAS